MDVQLKDQLQKTITIVAATTAVNNFGEPTMSTATTRLVRIVNREELIRDAQGQQSVSRQQIISDASLGIDDRIWLPGESTTGQPHQPQAIGERVDEKGDVDHFKCWL